MNALRQPEAVRWHLHGLNTGTIFALTHWGVSHIPRAMSYGIGHVGTWLAYHLMNEATTALIENLRVVVPNLGERELRALALRTYRNYARETIDFIRSLSIDRSELATWLSPLNTFDRVDRSAGAGLLLVTGHLGNIELGAVILRAIFDYPLAVVSLPDHDPSVHERRVRMRRSLGIETVEVRQDAESALRLRRLLSENWAVAMIADRPLGRDRVDVQFFGRRTGFVRAPALMGYLTGAPLVPSFILRQPDGRYAGFALDPIRVSRTGDRDANVQAAMQSFASALEAIVRQYPHLWYHFYPYWGAADSIAADRGP
jgi:lauroyl/myristoyl acyltransferase